MTDAGLAWKRVLLKISGEGMCKTGGTGIDPEEVDFIASETSEIHRLGAEVVLVIGGGNIVRGSVFAKRGLHKATADQMGMLATVINALALQDAIERHHGVESRVMTAINMADVAEPYIRRRCLRHLEKGRVAILAGGTGNPYFTTDTAAALRACELECDVLLKATKVDGVYDSDPMVNPNARRFDQLTYIEALNLGVKVMDAAAFSLCMDNDLPIIVFKLADPNSIERVVCGEPIGTLISR